MLGRQLICIKSLILLAEIKFNSFSLKKIILECKAMLISIQLL